MDEMGYEYAMTQYVEENNSYTMYMNKGRNRMADFVYGKQIITVEKATYLPKDMGILMYQGLKCLQKSTIEWNLMTLERTSTIRFSQPLITNVSWSLYWNVSKWLQDFGKTFDYRDKITKYKKSTR